MAVYYNENDPRMVAWLQELIKRGYIAPGDVDSRSIEDVDPQDVIGYDQCHWFAGIGGWSLALKMAGWPNDRPVWTGSPPCQPFSTAGKQGGYKDGRHLAPKWLSLIKECKPPIILGEQVASAASSEKHPWLDDLQDALEAEGYATGAIVLPACGVGAPHIRQRLWFVGKWVGNSVDSGLERYWRDGNYSYQSRWEHTAASGSTTETGTAGKTGPPSKDNFGWDGVEWLYCRDEQWRPVESGTFPLANGVPARVGRLRGYGNAIVPQVASEVIQALLDWEQQNEEG